jgi:hypothetical protein
MVLMAYLLCWTFSLALLANPFLFCWPSCLDIYISLEKKVLWPSSFFVGLSNCLINGLSFLWAYPLLPFGFSCWFILYVGLQSNIFITYPFVSLEYGLPAGLLLTILIPSCWPILSVTLSFPVWPGLSFM